MLVTETAKIINQDFKIITEIVCLQHASPASMLSTNL